MFWLAEVFNGSFSREEMQRYEQWAHRARAEALSGGLAGLGRGLARGVAALGAALRASHRRRRTAQQLRGLDDHMLADIGLTRDDLYRLNRGEWPTRLPDAPDERRVAKQPRAAAGQGTKEQHGVGPDRAGQADWRRAA